MNIYIGVKYNTHYYHGGMYNISTPVFQLRDGDDRMTTFPVARPDIFAFYTKSRDCFWTPGEITTVTDVIHYSTKLTPGEQRFVKYILAFFAASDGIVNVNLAKRFKDDIPMQDASYFYNFQMMMEDIHAHMYSIILDAIVPDRTERDNLINASQTIPVISKMSDYMNRCISSGAPFAERLLRMACVEGIFFTGCFCAIYWLQSRGLMPALAHSNELISRDEALHTEFALHMYNMIEPEHRLSKLRIGVIFEEAVSIAAEFITDALPGGLQEMNAALMTDYIKCQADILLSLIGMPPQYNTKHQFHFMDQINMTNRTNFFERRVSEYSKVQGADTEEYHIDEDF